MKRKAYLFLCGIMIIALFAGGCGETWDMDTDTEFQNAADQALEEYLRGGEYQDTVGDLFERFSERYSLEEMENYTTRELARLEAELSETIEKLGEREEELAAEQDRHLDVLEETGDPATMEELLEKYDEYQKQETELLAELETTEDIYRMIEIREEIIEILEKAVSDLEKARS